MKPETNQSTETPADTPSGEGLSSPPCYAKIDTPMRQCLFFREEGFYPIELPEGTIADNANCNPGTLLVEDAVTGEILWQNSRANKG